MRSASGPRASLLRASLCASVAWGAPGRAAEPPAPPGAPAASTLDLQRQRLRDVVEGAAEAEAARRQGEADVAAIRAERAAMATSLIDATARVREIETRAAAIEKQVAALTGDEDAIHASLRARRTTIAEVLAALQRMGLRPLPAVLASPDDVLRAIRSAMLLGAVVPELRSAAEALASDLAALSRLRSSILQRGDELKAELASLGRERDRMSALIDARQRAQAQAEGALDGERRRADALGQQAQDLRDLVAKLEDQAAAARSADERARRAARADADAVQAKAAAGTRDPARLAPEVPFADNRGRLTPPVAGKMVKSFGDADAYGGQERGASFATRAGAVVTAPADAWVSFSGPYRSYGQLLILNAGEGYYVVLAGLQRADVVPGQFVMAGEPVGAMGDGTVKTAASIALGAADPVLYVEFRKDGAAIDPSPWWAKAETEKVRG